MEKELNKLHTHIGRSKFAIFAVVGFLALLTYLLITVSSQLASTSITTDTSARGIVRGPWPIPGLPEVPPIPSPGEGKIGEAYTQDGDSCYTIQMESGSGIEFAGAKQYCRNLQFSCNQVALSESAKADLAQRLQSALSSIYRYSGTCRASGSTVFCTDDNTRSCPGFGTTAKLILEDACGCNGTSTAPGGDTPIISQTPEPTDNPYTPVDPIAPIDPGRPIPIPSVNPPSPDR